MVHCAKMVSGTNLSAVDILHDAILTKEEPSIKDLRALILTEIRRQRGNFEFKEFPTKLRSTRTKVCIACGEDFPCAAFYQYSNGKLYGRCKECLKKIVSITKYGDKSDDQKQRIGTSIKKWRKANPEQVRKMKRDYYHKNNETIKAKRKQYRLNNVEKVRAYDTKWRRKIASQLENK